MELPSADSGKAVNGTESTALDTLSLGCQQAQKQIWDGIGIWIQASEDPGGPGLEDRFESNIKVVKLGEITLEVDVNN